MDCRDVMRPIKVSLHADKDIGEAVDFMVDSHMGLVPVVEEEGDVFVGLLGGHNLMKALLPRTLNIIRGMKRASYLRENREDLRERLDELRGLPIRTLVDHDVATVHPDTPLIDALMLLSQGQNVVPVVDPTDGRLLGAISFFSVLRVCTDGDEEGGEDRA